VRGGGLGTTLAAARALALLVIAFLDVAAVILRFCTEDNGRPLAWPIKPDTTGFVSAGTFS
jgi:hypothetical protein